ncbi:hypothetical protein [Tenacibaculum sp. 190524A02b]|uniref:hypothetical protein n=1 Tax=Tenacibaculum vairaonense TaxID=3137860 RepID=UPI0032B2CD4E
MKKYKFSVGTIVTLKSHPLLYNLEIKGDGKMIPPFMVVKEVFIKSKNKTTLCEDLGLQIADKIKYTCVFFDDNKTEFKEVILYESMLNDYTNIYIARKDDILDNKPEGYESLIEEAKRYKAPNYEYGSLILFKTKKFEVFKKRTSTKKIKTIPKAGNKKEESEEIKTLQYIVNYSSPEFVLCGIKKNDSKREFYPNGSLKKEISELLFKVKWFNSSQMKFSDIYLPKECFIDIKYIRDKTPQ